MEIQFTIIDGPDGTLFALPEDTPILTVVAFTALVHHLNTVTLRLRAAEDELANFCGYAPKRND